MNFLKITRLTEALAIQAPIDGVSIPTLGTATDARIDFQPAATAQQRINAQAALVAFDWSDAAQQAWQDAKMPDRVTLVNQAQNAIDGNTTFLAIPTPSQAQSLAQIQALTQQNTKIIKFLLEV